MLRIKKQKQNPEGTIVPLGTAEIGSGRLIFV